MIKTIDFHINQLDTMKKYPSELYYIGNTQLLHKKSVSFVGSRKPNQYAKQITHTLASDVRYNNKLKSTRTNLNGINHGS